MRRALISALPHDTRRTLLKYWRRDRFKRLQAFRQHEVDGYTFRQFEQTRSLFIHIPKAAGISVGRALFGDMTPGHYSYQTYQVVYDKKTLDSLFIFTFVRNPWDRLYSAYNFLKAGGMNEHDRLWAEDNLTGIASFEDFVTGWLANNDPDRGIHFIPQTKFLADYRDHIGRLDYLGFFETIQQDFAAISAHVRPGAVLPHENASKPSSSKRYIEAYTDKMIDIVAKVYAADIDLLGYDFESNALDQQIAARQTVSGRPVIHEGVA